MKIETLPLKKEVERIFELPELPDGIIIGLEDMFDKFKARDAKLNEFFSKFGKSLEPMASAIAKIIGREKCPKELLFQVLGFVKNFQENDGEDMMFIGDGGLDFIAD